MQVHIAELYKHLQVLATTCTTNLLWTVFKENVLKIAKTYIPERKPRPSRFWLSRKTKTICGKKRKLFRAYKSYPTAHNLEQLKVIGNLSKRLIRRDYKAFIDSHILLNLKKGNSKPLFQLLAKSTKGSNTSNITQLHNCDSDSDMAASFAAIFQSVFYHRQ